MYPSLNELLDLLEIDDDRIESGRLRQAAVWRRQKTDRVPLLLGRSESRQAAERVGPQHLRLAEHQLRGGRAVPEYHHFDHYTMGEQFDDLRKMLIEAVWDMIGWSRTPGDAQLSFRPNFGVGTVASVFGCKVHAPPNDMPWVETKPTREAILDVDLDALDSAGLMPRVIDFIRLARESLKEFPGLRVFMPDLQGPMNTAFLLRGQDVFYDMVDDPVFYHRLMEIVTEVFIRLTLRIKQELGEPAESGWHGALYMTGGGVRVVDDVSIMLSPAQYEEFSLPYIRRSLAPFGGGWVHSCGDISHQMQFYLDAPEIRCVNLGEPHYYDFSRLLPRFAAANKFCYGRPVREPGESVPEYFRRTAGYLDGAENTLIFMPKYRGMEMTEGDWPEPEEMVALWERLCRQ